MFAFKYTVRQLFSVPRLVALVVVNEELGVVLRHQKVILPKLNWLFNLNIPDSFKQVSILVAGKMKSHSIESSEIQIPFV